MKNLNLTVVSENGVVVPATKKIFSLDSIFYPIIEESGVPTIYSRDNKTRNRFKKFQISETMSDIIDVISDTSTFESEDVGYLYLAVLAKDRKLYTSPKLMIFPIQNLSSPIRSVVNPIVSGTVLSGTYSEIYTLDVNTGDNCSFLVEETFNELLGYANDNLYGVKRLVELDVLWRDYKKGSALSAASSYPQAMLFPTRLIEVPISEQNETISLNEEYGITLFVQEKALNKTIAYKTTLPGIETTLDAFYELLTVTNPCEAEDMIYIKFTISATTGLTFNNYVTGLSVGTYVATDELTVSLLSGKTLKDYEIWVGNNKLNHLNSAAANNHLDPVASTGTTIKLLAGRNLFQPGREVVIILKN